MALNFDLLKLANIFNPPIQDYSGGMDMPSQGGITGTLPRGGDNSGTQPDLMTTIQALLHPQEQQFQNFSDMISQMPQRQNYQPSKFRQVAAAIAGMGTGGPVGIANGQVVGYKSNIPEGQKVQQSIKDEPYNQALTDWANKLGPTEKIAQMEQNRNVSNRQLGLGEMARKTAQDRADEQVRKDKEHEADVDADRVIKQQRANVYQYKTEHPNLIIKEDSNGNLVGIDPQSGKSDQVLDTDGNPVKSAIMTDAEKLKQVQENKEKEITLRGTQSRLTEGFKEANRKEMEATRQINRLDLKQTPSGGTPNTANGGKPLSPSAERTANQNKAVGIINEHPELKQYFVYGGNKQPTGELVPGKDPNDAGYAIAQRLMGKSSDISLDNGKIPPEVNPKLNVEPSPSATQPTRELARQEDPKIKAARAKVEAGYVLITDGKSFGQVKPADTGKLPKGWMVVK